MADTPSSDSRRSTTLVIGKGSRSAYQECDVLPDFERGFRKSLVRTRFQCTQRRRRQLTHFVSDVGLCGASQAVGPAATLRSRGHTTSSTCELWSIFAILNDVCAGHSITGHPKWPGINPPYIHRRSPRTANRPRGRRKRGAESPNGRRGCRQPRGEAEQRQEDTTPAPRVNSSTPVSPRLHPHPLYPCRIPSLDRHTESGPIHRHTESINSPAGKPSCPVDAYGEWTELHRGRSNCPGPAPSRSRSARRFRTSGSEGAATSAGTPAYVRMSPRTATEIRKRAAGAPLSRGGPGGPGVTSPLRQSPRRPACGAASCPACPRPSGEAARRTSREQARTSCRAPRGPSPAERAP